MNSACPLCNAKRTSEISAGDSVYYRCTRCDLIFLDSRFHLSPQEEKWRYEQHNNTIEEEGYVNFLGKFLEEAVEPYLTDQMRVLDYGSGPSPVLCQLLAQKGIVAEAYDPYFAPKNLQAGYDLITCSEVMEHVYEPATVLAELVHLLHPGGYLSIMTRFHPGEEHFTGWWYHRDPTHVVFYSTTTMNWTARQYPLQIVFINGFDKVVFRRL